MIHNLPRKIISYSENVYEIMLHSLTGSEMSQKRFVIFGRGRSGSTVLVNLLDSIKGLHCDGEILSNPVPFPFLHVVSKCANSKASIYGCKILSYQILEVQRIKDPKIFLKNLNSNNFQIIYLKRENFLYHAISNIRARKFGFHKKRTDNIVSKKITVDMDELLSWIKGSESLEKSEELLLEGIPHLSLTYEKNLENVEEHQKTVDSICKFLGINTDKVETIYQKISPKTIEQSVENYDELVSFLKNTKYEKYL